MARKVSTAERSALHLALAGLKEHPDINLDPVLARTAVRLLAELHPGGSVELRIPPVAAVQLGIGERGAHTRGTPPNVVETDPQTLLALAAGTLTWPVALVDGRVRASGPHADLSAVLPLWEVLTA